MANRKSSVTSLLSKLGNSKSSGSTDLIGGAQSGSPSGTTERISSAGDTRSVSLGSNSKVTGINFGRPSSSGTSTTSSSTSSEWTNLLKQTASGGIASALGGGLGSFGGIGTIISGITSLFGGSGKATPPALVKFELPQSVQSTVYSSAKGSSTFSGPTVETPQGGTAGQGIYTSSSLPYQSSDIAQAVKTALLNSSSLNDVISEL